MGCILSMFTFWTELLLLLWWFFSFFFYRKFPTKLLSSLFKIMHIDSFVWNFGWNSLQIGWQKKEEELVNFNFLVRKSRCDAQEYVKYSFTAITSSSLWKHQMGNRYKNYIDYVVWKLDLNELFQIHKTMFRLCDILFLLLFVLNCFVIFQDSSLFKNELKKTRIERSFQFMIVVTRMCIYTASTRLK